MGRMGLWGRDCVRGGREDCGLDVIYERRKRMKMWIVYSCLYSIF